MATRCRVSTGSVGMGLPCACSELLLGDTWGLGAAVAAYMHAADELRLVESSLLHMLSHKHALS